MFGEYILTCLIHSYIFFINNKQNYSSFCVRRQNYSSPVSHFTLLFWKIWSALINYECPLWENTLQRRTFVTNMSVEIKKKSWPRTFLKYVLIYHKQHIILSITDKYKYTVPDVFYKTVSVQCYHISFHIEVSYVMIYESLDCLLDYKINKWNY